MCMFPVPIILTTSLRYPRQALINYVFLFMQCWATWYMIYVWMEWVWNTTPLFCVYCFIRVLEWNKIKFVKIGKIKNSFVNDKLVCCYKIMNTDFVMKSHKSLLIFNHAYWSSNYYFNSKTIMMSIMGGVVLYNMYGLHKCFDLSNIWSDLEILFISKLNEKMTIKKCFDQKWCFNRSTVYQDYIVLIPVNRPSLGIILFRDTGVCWIRSSIVIVDPYVQYVNKKDDCKKYPLFLFSFYIDY